MHQFVRIMKNVNKNAIRIGVEIVLNSIKIISTCPLSKWRAHDCEQRAYLLARAHQHTSR